MLLAGALATNALRGVMRRGLVATPLGQVHYVDHRPADDGTSAVPLVCLHMSPRSADEFAEVGAILSKQGRRVIAIDEPGYGMSDNPNESCSLEGIAASVVSVVDALELERFAVAGSLMGCYTTLQLAASLGSDRVSAIVLTHPFKWRDVETTQKKQESEIDTTDSWVLQDDGSHLVELWAKRKGWLSAEMNNRMVADELAYLMKRRVRYAQGISIQPPQFFPFDEKAASVRCRTLVLLGSQAVHFFDQIGMEGTQRFAAATAALPAALVKQHTIEGGSINLLNTHADEWATVVSDFLLE